MSGFRTHATAAGHRAAAAMSQVLPEAVVRPMFRFAADLAWRKRGRGVRQLERNLRRVVGDTMPDDEFAALSRRALRSYARYWLEFFRLPKLGEQRVVGRMVVKGKEYLDEAMAQGRGAILALPHTGNWDHAGAWLSYQGYPFTTVAERLKPESLFDRFVRVRERLGMEVLALTGDSRQAYAVLLERLRAGKLVCLVTERDLSDRGVQVSFFGEPMTMPGGPASLALSTGAALLPVGVWFTDDAGPGGRQPGGWAGLIHPQIVPPAEGDRRSKIAEMTQQLADAFAHDIAENPQDWHMLQPLWLADRRAVRPRSEADAS